MSAAARPAGVVVLLLLLCGTVGFVAHQLSSSWILFGAHPEILSELEQSLEELKQVAQLEPSRTASARRSFDTRQQLLQRLRILEASRERVADVLLAFVIGLILAVATIAFALHQWSARRRQRQLRELKGGIEALTLGADPKLASVSGGTTGEVARMIEHAARTVGAERQRLLELDQLQAWREGARRLGHEMRTPLTSIQLDLQRLTDERTTGRAARETIHQRLQSSFRTLQSFLDRFTASAKLPTPRPEPVDWALSLQDFTEAFDGAWPYLELVSDRQGTLHGCLALADKEALRQVLVNLIANSWRATAPSESSPTTVTLRSFDDESRVFVDVIDQGPGVCDSQRERIFRPYVSNRVSAGEGSELGLGLAISRMLILQQGGSLEALPQRQATELGGGAVFRLGLPKATPA